MESIDKHDSTKEFITARIRAACREGFESSIPYVAAIAKGEISDAPFSATIRALDTLGKYGMGRSSDVLMEKPEWLDIIVGVTSRHIPDPETFQDWWNEVVTQIKEAT